MRDYPVPDSLQEWSDLNDQADQAAKAEEWEEYDRLGEQILAVWEAAPFRDRTRVSWELLKKAWRERHTDLEDGLSRPS